MRIFNKYVITPRKMYVITFCIGFILGALIL